MMRIALLGPANVIHLQRWAQALTERGHKVCVLTQHPVDLTLFSAVDEIVDLPYHGQMGYIFNARHVRAALEHWQPDIFNAHYASGYGTTAMLCGIRPLLLSVWGSDVYDFPYENRMKGWLLRKNLRHATAIASTSHAMAAQVRRLIPDVGEIAVTPFGVDVNCFGPHPESKDENWITIGIVKTLAPKYGVDLLLRAFAGMLHDPRIQALPQACRLLVVGQGPQRAELESLAAGLGIADRTRFVGGVPHDEVPEWLNRLDIYSAPSRLDSESFGVAVIEASACGLPVVVSDVGGLPEVVRNGETGLIVQRENVGSLQSALVTLAIDAGLRKCLGENGRKHVLKNYAWDYCVDIMENLYASIISGVMNSKRNAD